MILSSPFKYTAAKRFLEMCQHPAESIFMSLLCFECNILIFHERKDTWDYVKLRQTLWKIYIFDGKINIMLKKYLICDFPQNRIVNWPFCLMKQDYVACMVGDVK